MRINISKENILSRTQLPGSALQLALFRIALGVQIFYSSSSKLFDLLQVVDGTKGTKTIFPSFIDNFIITISSPYLVIVVQVLSFFLVLGLFTKYILPLLFIGFVLLFSFWYSKFNAPVPWLYIWFPLLILSFSRCSDKLSLDAKLGLTKPETENTTIYRWPIEIIVGWFAYIYVAAGLAKIIPFHKGLGWMYGGTSQGIIHDRFLDSVLYYIFGKPFFDYTEYSLLFGALSIFSLLIELFCIVLFFTNRFNYWIIFLVISMHFFLYLTGVPAFMQTALILCVCLLPPKLFTKKNKSI
jgi:hypothetical protein